MLHIGSPIHLEPGTPKVHQTQRPDEWIFQLLGLPTPSPGTVSPFYLTEIGWDDVEVMREGHHPLLRRIQLKKFYMKALKAWARRKMFPTDDIDHLRLVLVIASPDGKFFLLQMKDGNHPVQHIRGNFSLYSSQRLKGEDENETLVRFLFKEIEDPDLAARFLRRARRMPWQMMYDAALDEMIICAWYVSVAPNISSFMSWSHRLVEKQGNRQSKPSILCLEQVHWLAEEEMKQPGSTFVAGQQDLLLRVADMLQQS
jgi:hypothetical protein